MVSDLVVPRFETVSASDVDLARRRRWHPSPIEFWDRHGAVDPSLDAQGDRVVDTYNRILAPREIVELVDVPMFPDPEFHRFGIPFFVWFDLEFLCMDEEGRVIDPEAPSGSVVAPDLATFLERLIAEPDWPIRGDS